MRGGLSADGPIGADAPRERGVHTVRASRTEVKPSMDAIRFMVLLTATAMPAKGCARKRQSGELTIDTLAV